MSEACNSERWGGGRRKGGMFDLKETASSQLQQGIALHKSAGWMWVLFSFETSLSCVLLSPFSLTTLFFGTGWQLQSFSYVAFQPAVLPFWFLFLFLFFFLHKSNPEESSRLIPSSRTNSGSLRTSKSLHFPEPRLHLLNNDRVKHYTVCCEDFQRSDHKWLCHLKTLAA